MPRRALARTAALKRRSANGGNADRMPRAFADLRRVAGVALCESMESSKARIKSRRRTDDDVPRSVWQTADVALGKR